MRKIKDRLLLGLVSGLIGATPGRLLNAAEYHRGIVDVKYGQMASSLFTGKKRVNTPEGKILGSLAHELLTITTGTAITYTLSATGRDYAPLKGMGIGALYWFMLYGLNTNLKYSAKNERPYSHLLGLVDHLLFGALAGTVASKLGDNSLFPDNSVKDQDEKQPLIFE